MRLHTQFDPTGPITFIVTGHVDAACIAEFDYVFGVAHRLGKVICLDLTRMTDVDRATLQYLADRVSADVTVVYRQANGNLPA
jgi:hypothetical protein